MDPFRAVLARHNIVHRIKVGREDLAIIDRRIQLLKRGLDYLQAVGDVMTDERLDCLLLDPVGWSAPSFYPQP